MSKCDGCRGDLGSKRAGAKFCGSACRQAAYNQRKGRARWHAEREREAAASAVLAELDPSTLAALAAYAGDHGRRNPGPLGRLVLSMVRT